MSELDISELEHENRLLRARNERLERELADEREAVCRIVVGLCISDNNAQEIVSAIRARGQA